MKILIFENKHFGLEDVKDALTRMGHTYKVVSTPLILERKSAEFEKIFEDSIGSKGTFDVVFTFNYSVSVSNCCNNYGIKYISWIYDSPLVSLYSYTITNPCNYIFIFDKAQYLELKNGGIDTVYYAPLAGNLNRLDSINITENIYNIFKSDVAFVGSMYNEAHNFYDRLTSLPPYVKGYIDAIMEAQSKIYGANFLEELITPPVLEALQKCTPYTVNADGIETPQYVYANYFFARRIAQLERHNILSSISEKYNTCLYTHNPTPQLPKVTNRGPIDYYDNMPFVFKCSKINLNISLRSIKSGIPLRGIDIMSAGGFLLSNFQADFLDYFVPDEDFVYFESIEDAVNKCGYYLSHDSKREQIARNGHDKIKEFHTYEKRLSEIFEIVM